MIRRYRSSPRYVDLSPTSPLWPGSLLLTSVLVSIILMQELPFAVNLTRAIARVSESCPGYTPDIQPSDSVVAVDEPGPENPFNNCPAGRAPARR